MRVGGKEEGSPAACQGQRKPSKLYKDWWKEAGGKCSQGIQEPGLALSFEGQDVPGHIMVSSWKTKTKSKTWKQ